MPPSAHRSRPASPDLQPPINLLVARFEQLSAEGLCRMAGNAGSFCVGDRAYELPRVICRASKMRHPLRIGVFTGLRGNIEGGWALLHFVESLRSRPWRTAGVELSLYPLCNPTGHEDRTGANRRGVSLDGDFWKGSSEPEIMLLETELRERKFDVVVSLCTQDSSAEFTGSAATTGAAQRILECALALAGLASSRPGVVTPFAEGALSAPPSSGRSSVSLRFGAPRQGPMQPRLVALEAAIGGVLAAARHELQPQ